jgi:type I restriction enzyme S subunit
MFIRDGQDLNYNNFRQVKLPFPSTDEQSRIAEFLDREISKSSALLAKTEEAINKLLEYRSALISAAVTGEIDVRNYRPQEAAVLCQ